MKFQDIPNEVFEATVRKNFADTDLEGAFYAKIAGASHPNRDGTSRTKIIGKCDVGDPLEFRPEPENEFDPDAIAVTRLGTDEQLGYLDARLASEVARDFRRYGPCRVGLFRHPDYHPGTGAIVGAVIYVLKLSSEKLEG